MQVRSIRVRLTLWYSAILLVTLLLFGAILWTAVSHSAYSGIEKRLSEAAKGIRVVLDHDAGEDDFDEELEEYVRAATGPALLRLRDGAGRELIPASPLASIAHGNERVFYHGEQFATHREQVSTRGHYFEIETALPLTETNQILAEFRNLLLVAIPLAVLMAFFGGYWLSRRALAPVDDLTSAAMRISVDNLSERLPVRPTGDELQRLASTWNEMLARLQSSVHRMTSFTADASHELRTPISVILTSAEVALRRDRTPDEYRTALSGIVSEAQRMSDLTEDLLALARADARGSLPREPLDGGNLIDEVANEAAASAKQAGVTLVTRINRQAPAVSANRAAVKRVLLILIDNALKHTPAGGTIEVYCSASDEGTAFGVRDTGEGIAPADIGHIFERFYRADKSRTGKRGVGLGLSIAQSIARTHGSEIHVESSPGTGSHFFFTLSGNLQT